MSEGGNSSSVDSTPPLKTIALFAGIYCYFTGWTYAYYMLNHFGISHTSIEIPTYYFIIYSGSS